MMSLNSSAWVTAYAYLFVEALVQSLESWQEDFVCLAHGCDVHNSGETVVAGLAHVDMIVGVDLLAAYLPSEDLDGPISDDLIRVHVRLSARAGLPHNQGEVFIKFPCDYLVARLHNGLG